MVAKMDEAGWESVANVHFQPLTAGEPVPQQPPQVFDNSPTESEVSSPPSLDDTPIPTPTESRPAKQYVFGVPIAPPQDTRGARIVETVAKKPASQENVIEAEIRDQQNRETEMRRQQTLKSTEVREKGASSPASHDSDEGFVDRLEVTGPLPSLPVTPPGYTHTIPGTDGEPIIYDSVSPQPPEYLSDRSTPTPSNPPVTTTPAVSNATEARIALEIRELKEREDELRQMRVELMASRENLLEDEEVRSSASREQLLEDHLTSLTTTTDEGNFSECGDPASSEDKSSDGSNSRMMSPDLHLDFGRRRVTVKPYEEEVEEDQPVYTRMQKESVIEREIRLSREREEAYRKEKGLVNGSTSAQPRSTTVQTPPVSSASPLPAAPLPQVPQTNGRDVQHRIATSRIQLEIRETGQKERELRDSGQILTTSEESVDAKVTRMSDFCDMGQLESPRSQVLPSTPRPSTSTTPASTPKRCASPRSPASPVPNFTPSPALNRNGLSNGFSNGFSNGLSNGLSRSLSTNNLSSTSTARPTKGLMQKFIASRGKMTGSAFTSPPPTLTHTTSRGVLTRPMRVEPKAAVIQRETQAKVKPEVAAVISLRPENTSPPAQHPKQFYRRSYCTAEEKIQSELKDMQMREEELRRLRAFQMARSQPNLLDIGIDEDQDLMEEESNHSLSEMNGLRPAQSIPNILDEPEQSQVPDKAVRRRSALIAQWENRIQQTTDT
ncbi:hypothetical protein GWK47_010554 [Chionoecetes opilio]|uniref:A-kinase anchor protein 2 C-terminal domain-containing protein n=1 Tax=Chionoecetes opilio TaxID=41210 RepID=A0A8J5C367_CHIOP|nr:hypothetical protein GWK47_010554 [Chionoecetes opilio]